MGQEGRSAEGPAAVLNTLTESKQFDKIKISKKAKDNKTRAPVIPEHTATAVQILWGNSPAKAVASIWQDVFGVQQSRTLQKGLLQ